jgi:hypothetical protein
LIVRRFIPSEYAEPFKPSSEELELKTTFFFAGGADFGKVAFGISPSSEELELEETVKLFFGGAIFGFGNAAFGISPSFELDTTFFFGEGAIFCFCFGKVAIGDSKNNVE